MNGKNPNGRHLYEGNESMKRTNNMQFRSMNITKTKTKSKTKTKQKPMGVDHLVEQLVATLEADIREACKESQKTTEMPEVKLTNLVAFNDDAALQNVDYHCGNKLKRINAIFSEVETSGDNILATEAPADLMVDNDFLMNERKFEADIEAMKIPMLKHIEKMEEQYKTAGRGLKLGLGLGLGLGPDLTVSNSLDLIKMNMQLAKASSKLEMEENYAKQIIDHSNSLLDILDKSDIAKRIELTDLQCDLKTLITIINGKLNSNVAMDKQKENKIVSKKLVPKKITTKKLVRQDTFEMISPTVENRVYADASKTGRLMEYQNIGELNGEWSKIVKRILKLPIEERIKFAKFILPKTMSIQLSSDHSGSPK